MQADLLLEIGTEELPPKSLPKLGEAMATEFGKELAAKALTYESIRPLYTPRRLALIVSFLVSAQEDSVQMRKGPAQKASLDDNGEPTKALQGFARSCGVEIARLKIKDDYYYFSKEVKGQKTKELVPEMLKIALDKLPIAKRMRWGSRSEDFVRPVHWLLALYDGEVIPVTLFGLESSNQTRGHRFHQPQPVTINSADEYEAKLAKARVIVDFKKRRELIKAAVISEASKLNASANIDPELLDEVTALVEYPVAILGGFDREFLQMPPEAIIAFMQDHQKFFALFDKDNNLLPNFITISNIESKQPELVRQGNERVIRPRLNDALFFWQQDKAKGLKAMGQGLAQVVYQDKLGSVQDKVLRVAKLAAYLAGEIGGEPKLAEQAANLAKADLLSGMVGEFPKLEGIMGRYYAVEQGEDKEVAQAIEEQYLPKFSGDKIPKTTTGMALSLADRIDTLLGIFSIGLEPTGDKDPFALRRLAIGVLRIIHEAELNLDLAQVFGFAATLLDKADDKTVAKVKEFTLERLKRLRLDAGTQVEVFEAIREIAPFDVLDIIRREQAVENFLQGDSTQSLSEANKRIANILKKNPPPDDLEVTPDAFVEAEETALYEAQKNAAEAASAELAAKNYTKALEVLAGLKQPIAEFFDQVLVMADDEVLKNNRLAMLNNIRNTFLQIADISKLAP